MGKLHILKGYFGKRKAKNKVVDRQWQLSDIILTFNLPHRGYPHIRSSHSSFQRNAPKQTVYEKGKKLSKPKTKNITNPFILKMKKKIKDKIITDNRPFFKTEEEKKKERN